MSVPLQLVLEYLPRSLVWDPPLSDDAVESSCMANHLFHIERTKEGVIRVHPPRDGFTSYANAEIAVQLRQWWATHHCGVSVGSNCGFFLPDGSMFSPDAAYMLPETLQHVTAAQFARFPHFCPDFVLELLPREEALSEIQGKMEIWMANGAALGWLVDPYRHQVHIYEPGAEVSIVSGSLVRGRAPVEGFNLDLIRIWCCNEI